MKTAYREWLGARLKHFRELHKLTTTQVAALLDMNLKTYSHYEEGVSMPSILTLERICAIYKITLDKFMQGSPVASFS